MSEETMDLTPQLTLTPDSAATQPQAPSLTLEPNADQQQAQAAQQAAQAQREANAVKIDESMLNEAERKMVDDFAQKIDITDSNVVLQYGAAAQKNIAAFSESALNNVKTKDLGEVGEALSSLVVELKTFGEPEKKGIAGFFQKRKNELEAMKASYAKAESNVDRIVKVLEEHQVTLMKDIAMFDQMYELNTKYNKELTMYIIAGKKRLEYLRSNDLVQLREKGMDRETLRWEALEIRAVCRRYGVPFLINDAADLAAEVGADGVHVGQQDMSPQQARAVLGPDGIVGVSAHTVEEARAAQAEGADYLGVGAVFATGTKENTTPVDYDTLKEICAAVNIPVVAIGGVGRDNLGTLAGSGIRGVAVVSALYAQPDVRAAARSLRKQVEEMLRR